MKLAIIVVGYNRPKCLARLFHSLSQARYDGADVTLIISIDKADNQEVERIARNFVWPHGEKRAVFHSQRLGLRKHILKCGEYANEFDAVIILEDDLYVSPIFLRFARQALDKYEGNAAIAGISLYTHLWNVNVSRPFMPSEDGSDAYFMQFAQSWGQVWSRRMWNEFYHWYLDHAAEGCEGDDIPAFVKRWPESSWLKYQIVYIIRHCKYFVYPRVSLTTNFGDAGQHVDSSSNAFQVPLLLSKRNMFDLPDYNDQSLRYDAFFERVGMGGYLGISEEELCVDIYGTKGNRQNKKFWLTMQPADFRRVASYRLSMRPHEINVILDVTGKDILLYDSTDRVAKVKWSRESNLVIKKTLYDTKAIPRKALLFSTLHHLVLAFKRFLNRRDR